MNTWIWTEPAATARRGRGREGIWWRWCVSDRAVGRIWSLALEKPGGGGTLVDGTGVVGVHSGNPKISGRVFRVLKNSGFQNSNPKFIMKK
jgi:hypothetical protein